MSNNANLIYFMSFSASKTAQKLIKLDPIHQHVGNSDGSGDRLVLVEREL